MVSTTFIVLLFGLLIPIFSNYQKIKLGSMFLFLSLILFITAAFQSSYSVDRKKPNSINYVLDADKNEAFWASYNNSIDDYTRQFLGDDPVKGGFDANTTSSKYGTGYKLHKQTEVKQIITPTLEIKGDTIINDFRTIDFSIIPQRHVNRIELLAENDISFNTFNINGVQLDKREGKDYVFHTKNKKQILTYYMTEKDSVLNITFSTPKKETPKLIIYEVAYDLFNNPKFEIEPRSEIMMPMPFVINDATIIKKQIEFDKK